MQLRLGGDTHRRRASQYFLRSLRGGKGNNFKMYTNDTTTTPMFYQWLHVFLILFCWHYYLCRRLACPCVCPAVTAHCNAALVSAEKVMRCIQCSLVKRSAQVHKCNTTTIQLQYKNSCTAVALHLCGPLQYNAAIQVFYNLHKTCRLLAAAIKTCIVVSK